ncbi:acyltransferase family protein [Georgenia thermotolerans]|uniref:Acyltransferase family protein n=2 Tax=Georgenia thermotolerans TaxID=527326 RepID=A0A7J5USH9_9MICO|nr:acyltransferase family protein [Georgenia thermotolerans]
MVVVYHVFLDRVSGGVDIFLMISAFLLTLSFVRKVEADRPLALTRHWLHRFKRLLPASAATILGTLVAVWAVVPSSRWTSILEQAWASLLYVQNWLLAATSVDYYARDDSLASPLQHFWSLSIQGQVFIVWPVIFAAGAWIARRIGWRYRTILWLAFGAIFVGSLAFSVHQTTTNQTFAYFDTRARLWEFAAGSLLALALPHLRLARPLRVVMGWTGVAGMLACGVLLPVGQSFPGYVALWPLISAGLVIAAGQSGSRLGVDRLLSSRALVGMGGISYALYLVHWPVLTVYLSAVGRPAAGPAAGIVIIVASIVAAHLITGLIEAPLRRAAWTEAHAWRMGVVVTACVAAVAAPAAAWQVNLDRRAAGAAAAAPADNPGALALQPGFRFAGAPDALTLPLPTELDDQWVSLDHGCTGVFAIADAEISATCSQNETLPAPERTILVVGDSHAQQWMAALSPLAKERNWQLVALLKGGCAFGAPTTEGFNPLCDDWLQRAWGYALELRPDAIFTVATAASADGPNEELVAGYEQMVAEMTAAGIDVIGVRDNPRFAFDMYACVERNGPDASQCTVRRDQALPATSPMQRLVGAEGLYLLDLTDRLCPDGLCPPVIGNLYVFMDDNHLSRSYAATLRQDLEERLLAATGW